MDSVASKIQETGHHAAKRTDAIFSRTREAGEALLDEVRGVGDEVVAFVRAETKGWKRFFSQRATQIQTETRSLLSVPALEKRVLTQVDATLRTIDAKVRARLTELEKPAPRKATTSNGATRPKTKRPSSTAKSTPARNSAIAGTAPSARH